MFGKNLQMNAISSFLVLIITLLISFSAQADIHTWTGSFGNSWSYSGNWDLSSAPGAMDSVLIGGGNNLPVYNDAQAVPLSRLVISNQGSLELSGDYTLVVVMDEYIGYDAEGFFTQNGGSHKVMGPLYLGYQGTVTEQWSVEDPYGFWIPIERYETPGGTGTYTLNSGTLTTTDEIIGVNGWGVFTQNGGIHTVVGTMVLGQEGKSTSSRYVSIYDGTVTALVTTSTSAGSGTYILNDGTMQAHKISAGDGAGKLIIDGGTLSVVSGNISVDTLILGNSSGSHGAYTQSYGTVRVGRETIGNQGQGTYVQTGGAHYVSQLDIGSQGTYELSGTGVLNTGRSYTNGTFNQIGGTHSSPYLRLFSTDSIYNLTDGDLNTSNALILLGTFNQDGGTHTTSYMLISGKEGSDCVYNLTDGVLRVQGNEKLGYDTGTTGIFNQIGGTHTVTETLTVGAGWLDIFDGDYGAGKGTYRLTGGQLSVGDEIIGVIGDGTFIQDGGTHVIENELMFGYIVGGGTYALNGGTLNVDAITVSGQYGILSIDGGSLGVNTGNISLTEFYLGKESGRSGSYTHSQGTITAYTKTTIGKYGTGDFTQTGGTHTIKDVLSLGRRAGSDGTYTLTDGDLTVENRELVGFYGTGTFNQTGGSHTVGETLYLGYRDSGRGTYTLDGGNLNAGYEQIGRKGIAAFTQNGGTNTVTDKLAIGSKGRYTQNGGTINTGGIINTGRFTSSGGTLTTGSGGIDNQGYMKLAGTGNQIGGQVTNTGTMEIAGTTAFTSDITNNGTFKTENTTITANGTYTENAAYSSSGSTSIINTLVVNETGYLKGGVTDEWIINLAFENYSLENEKWNTKDATLTFSGDIDHAIYLGGDDLGADLAGYIDNFAWGCLNIEGSLTLFDGNSEEGGALYVNTLTGLDILEGIITNILLDESNADVFNIYYLADLADNAYLGGLTYALANGGSLIGISNLASVPVPGSLFLLLSGMLVLLKIKRGRACNCK